MLDGAVIRHSRPFRSTNVSIRGQAWLERGKASAAAANFANAAGRPGVLAARCALCEWPARSGL
jgi:hypothetical protein